MIRIIVGGTGSGKSISAVKDMLDRKIDCYTNLQSKCPYLKRLEVADIIMKKTIGNKKDGTPIEALAINWDFWDKKIGTKFDITLDEAHNIMDSHASMTHFSRMMRTWITQVRKILGASQNTNLNLISQRFENIDVTSRELCHEIVHCQSMANESKIIDTVALEYGKQVTIKAPLTYIIKTYFSGEDCLNNFYDYRMGRKSYSRRGMFIANPYFKYNDSFSINRFGDEVYL